MAFTKNAGFGAHHTILLWPLPALGMGAVLASASEKLRHGSAWLAAVLSVVCGANLLVLSTYYTNLLRNGGTASWTEAMYPALGAIHSGDIVCTIDWGFFDTVRLFERGRTPLCQAADPVDDNGKRFALYQISQSGYVFLTHTEGNESFPGITGRLVRFAESSGFQRVRRQAFADANGRETVELFQFEKGVSRHE
jgi:hypothetical protein